AGDGDLRAEPAQSVRSATGELQHGRVRRDGGARVYRSVWAADEGGEPGAAVVTSPVSSNGAIVVHPTVEAKKRELTELCQRHGVRRLELFGSATSERFNPVTSDLDFLVEFAPAKGDGGYADRYF